jgi:heat shock protein HtpX
MNIYKNIDSNKRKTALYMFLFLVFVIGFGYLLSYLLNQYWILVVAILVSIIQALISYYYSDKIALSTTGAKLTSKEQFLELHRVVENLAITSGLPKPKIYIINDPAPNAFATGRDPKNASLAVTTGLLEIMDKNELQAVLAHEMSHIGNYDIRLMTIIIVLVGLVVLASDLFLRWNLWGRMSSDGENNQSGIVLLIIGIVLAIIAPLFATLMQLAISRKREFLADSDGVMLTRYPEGLISALKKLDKYSKKMIRVNKATAHLFISNPFGSKGIGTWFSTHPKISDRIKALEN